jgi:hypothetical protein
LYVAAYNQMPHDRLNVATPQEIYDGILPDATKRFAEIEAAAVNRLEKNKQFNCCRLLE